MGIKKNNSRSKKLPSALKLSSLKINKIYHLLRIDSSQKIVVPFPYKLVDYNDWQGGQVSGSAIVFSLANRNETTYKFEIVEPDEEFGMCNMEIVTSSRYEKDWLC